MISKHTELKRRARKDIHRTLSLNAYLYQPSDSTFSNPILVSARLHYGFGNQGDLTGTEYSYAQWLQQTEIFVIFHIEDVEREQVPVKSVLAFDRREVFKVEAKYPNDDQTFRCLVKKIINEDIFNSIGFPS